MDRIQEQITTLDLSVIAAYFGLIILIGIYVSRRTKTGDDLFLAGRTLGWGAIGFSLFASNISSSTLIGLTGSAYTTGIAPSAYEWLAGVPLLIMAFIFAPIFLKSKITTTPEYLDKRYSRRVRLYFSGLTIFFTIVVDCAGGLYAGGLVLNTFFPGLQLWQSAVAIGLFAGLYTAAGGLKAVVFTDVLQAVVLIGGSAILAYVMFAELDFSFQAIRDAVENENHLSMVLPLENETLPWPGLFFGVALLGFWYWVTNQYIVQRVLGAKSLPDAQWGAILGGMLKILPLFIMVFPGAMAAALLPDIEQADRVFPIMITELLPAGLTGLVLAGLIAAIMSSVDSTLNSSSTLVVTDFITKPEKELDPDTQRSYGTVATLVFMVLAIAWAPLIQFAGGLWDYLQQMFSVLVPPLVVLFMMGALSRFGTEKAGFWTLIFGHSIGAILFCLGNAGVMGLFGMDPVWPIHFTINVAIMTVASLVFYLLVSAVTEGRDLDDEVIWNREKSLEDAAWGRAWYADIRYQGVVLAGSMLAILILFW
ncbi:Sodium/glucose cotransporter [Rhodobacteraceae bacterium THAF1]|uniref:sodium:solute symporter n=1 Tax=Palleronia sp. THAF1 TaxID=2587842 RepID=UPI000F3FCC5C|nr:sodium:solute symporter [Palleronia sp. THAF1]QFU07375.1 Sodium/glucose cotransporter [Palleronia sp. THAF1]VDC20713.1 Sodium/glucose cotransporter [Rhodobacteraceae bacterium THAF1]